MHPGFKIKHAIFFICASLRSSAAFLSFKSLLILIALLTPLLSQPQPVSYWHVGTYDEALAIRHIAEMYEQKSGVRVHVQPIPWGSFQTKFLTAMASGEPPDCGASSLSSAVEYGKVGGVIDFQARYPDIANKLKAEIFPNMWPCCYFRGHLFSVPFNATALVGFYRKDIFKKLNLEEPKTWSELTRVLETLMANGYQYGFYWTRQTHWGMGTYCWPFKESLYRDNGETVNWLAPNFLKGYKYAIGLWNTYTYTFEKLVELFALKNTKQTPLPLFFNFEFNYTEILIRAPQVKDDLGFFPFPYPDDGIPLTIMGGRNIVIFRDGKNPDGAAKWIEFLLSKDAQVAQTKFMANLGERSQLMFPVNMKAWQEDLGLIPGHQQIFLEIYRRLRTEEGYPWSNESDRLLEQSFYKMYDILQEYLGQKANALNMGVGELKQAMAAGKQINVKAEYQHFLEDQSGKLLTDLSAQAQQKLDRDRLDYEKYFGSKLENALATDGRWDILSYAKLIGFALIFAFIMYVLFNAQACKSWISYLYISPPVIAALVFILIPIIVSLYLSFSVYNPVMPLSEAQWVGLKNYTNILQESTLWQSLLRSFYFAVLVLPIQLFIAVILAACLDKNIWPDRLYKFMYFSPLVTSVVSVSLIWFALYSATNYGWINSLLLNLNLVRDPIQFLKDKSTFLNSVIIMSIWQGLAFTILIYLAGLQNVSKELYEAAEIDGAGAFRQFFRISLPSLKPQVTFLVIMGTIGAIQVFEQIYMLGGGAGEAESKFGPDDSGMTIVPFLYRKGFEYFKMGEASAIAYILFLILFALTFINFKFLLKKEAA